VWDYYPFATNRTDTLTVVEVEHRQHAVVELAIRDLKDQAMAHFPSGKWGANAAWTVIAALAHNLLRWTQAIGLPNATTRTARTLRRRLLALPGRLVRSARRTTLRMPARWPWADDFLAALARLRALPPPNRPGPLRDDNPRHTTGLGLPATTPGHKPNDHSDTSAPTDEQLPNPADNKSLFNKLNSRPRQHPQDQTGGSRFRRTPTS
jgi:hypothetical protein